MKEIIELEIHRNFDQIESWIEKEKEAAPALLYSSVDLRESFFKLASVDTNIFPAGFNNLCAMNFTKLKSALNRFIKTNFKDVKTALLFCEDHTRNRFYLENIYYLAKTIEACGIKCTISTFFNDHPNVCKNDGFLNLETASGQTITVYCLEYILKNKQAFSMDICFLNNDLSDGNFSKLNNLEVPISPHPNLGWHKRKKSDHISKLNQLTHRLTKECKLSIDPWLMSTLITPIKHIDINSENDRNKIKREAEKLLELIKQKYQEHNIKDSPYLVIKSDTGTYGMGVISIQSPDEIEHLNRKKRNKLLKGKSAVPIQNLIIQEGIPSENKIDDFTSEEVLYHVNGTMVGGFYRIHERKTKKDILNSKGMSFKAYCHNLNKHECENNSCGISKKISKASYVIGQLANLAAQQEFQNL